MVFDSEPEDIVDCISDLHLNEDFSDVVFMIGDEKLPAHQSILGQRSPVFKKMFFKEKAEPKNQVIVSPDALLEPFKQFLLYIYAGFVRFKHLKVDDIFAIVDLANEYELPNLITACEFRLEHVSSIDNIVRIINGAVERSLDWLIDECLLYLTKHSAKFIKHGKFNALSVDALMRILMEKALKIDDDTVFGCFVGWMKANPAESEQFPKLLKHIRLDSVPLDDLVSAVRSLNFIDCNELMDIIHEQKQIPIYHDGNVLTSNNGYKVICGGVTSAIPSEGATMRHEVGNGKDENITIDLKRLYMLNCLDMELADGDKSYFIDVSKDNATWTRIVDHSNYVCRSGQRLRFNDTAVRYIRICGTFVVPRNGYQYFFEILNIEAYYKRPETEGREHVELTSTQLSYVTDPDLGSRRRGAIQHPMILVNGYSMNTIWKVFPEGDNPVIVQLPQPYLVDTIYLTYEGLKKQLCSYSVEVSTNNIDWTCVLSKENVEVFYSQNVSFEKRPIVFVKYTGTNITGIKFRIETEYKSHLGPPSGGPLEIVTLP